MPFYPADNFANLSSLHDSVGDVGKRDRQVPLWLTEEEEVAVVAAAEKQGITKQQFLRFLLRRELGFPVPGGVVH